MKINRDNYESYLMDYLDGNLPFSEKQEVETFLLLNSDLRDLLEEWQEVTLPSPHLHYSHKALLKKDELHACTDYYAIAAAENALTETDKKFLQKYPEYQKESPFYSKLKLRADPEIHYSHKKKLYRPTLFWQWSARYAVVAAIAGLLLLLSPLFYQTYFVDTPSSETDRITLTSIPKIILNEEITLNQIQIALEIIPISLAPTAPAVERKRVEPIQSARLPLITLASSPPAVTLTHTRPNLSVLYPEIYLAESASIWKTSGRNFFSDNIFNSMITASKSLAEKLKNITKQE